MRRRPKKKRAIGKDPNGEGVSGGWGESKRGQVSRRGVSNKGGRDLRSGGSNSCWPINRWKWSSCFSFNGMLASWLLTVVRVGWGVREWTWWRNCKIKIHFIVYWHSVFPDTWLVQKSTGISPLSSWPACTGDNPCFIYLQHTQCCNTTTVKQISRTNTEIVCNYVNAFCQAAFRREAIGVHSVLCYSDIPVSSWVKEKLCDLLTS